MSTKLGDIRFDLKLSTKELRRDIDRATKEIKKLGGNVKKQSKTFDTWRNSTVRMVRQLETLVIAYYAVGGAMTHVVGKGIELNKMYEDQALGIAALTAAKVKMYDETGRELNGYETFLASQKMTAGVMEDIKKAALETPASFQQMIGFYQQTIGHAISGNQTFGKSMEDVNKNVITFTQRMSALGSAVGMEMPKINEEIRSLMSGNASTDSLLAMMLFGSPTEANEAVRAAKKTTEGLSTLLLDALEPFKHVEGVQTYSKSMAQLSAAFDDLRKGATQPLFDDLKGIAIAMRDFLNSNMTELINAFTTIYNILKVDINGEMKYMRKITDSIVQLMDELSFGANDVVGELVKGNTAWDYWVNMMVLMQKGMGYLAAGVKTVTNAFYQAKMVTAGVVGAVSNGSMSGTEEKRLANINRLKKEGFTLSKFQTDEYARLSAIKSNIAETEAYIAGLQEKVVDNRKDIKSYTEQSLADIKAEMEVAYNKQKMDQKALKDKQALDRAAVKNLKVIQRGEAAVKEAGKTSKAVNKNLKERRKLQKQADQEAKRAIQEYERLLEDINNRYEDSLNGLVSSILGGDIGGIFQSINDGFITMLDDMEVGFTGFSAMLDGITMSSVWGLLFTAGMSVLDAFMGQEPISKEEWQKANGITLDGGSESVVNLLESMDWSLTRELTYSKGIYDNMSALVAQSGRAAVSLTSNFGFANQDAYTPGAIGGLWGGKDTKTLFTGLVLELKALDTISAQTMEVIQKTKTSWFGLKSKTSEKTYYSDLDAGSMSAIQQAYEHGLTAFVGASAALGSTITDSMLESAMKSLDVHKLDFEGKSQDEIAAMINGAIGGDLDQITAELMGWVADYQVVNENLLETMGRLAYELEVVDYGFIQLGESISVTGEDAVAMSQAFVEASNGMDNALANINGYIDNFYTEAEKQNLRIKQLEATGLFDSVENYTAEVSRMQSGAAGGSTTDATRLADLLRLQSAYREYFDEIASHADEMVAITDEYIDLTDDRMKSAQSELDFHKDIVGRIENVYTGSLSYFNDLEKSAYLGSYALDKLAAGDSQGYFDALYKQLGYDMNMSTTREDYAQKVDAYVDILQTAEKPKTVTDAVVILEQILVQDKRLEAAIAKGSYQAPLSTTYEGL